jgi:hypothetical protein
LLGSAVQHLHTAAHTDGDDVATSAECCHRGCSWYCPLCSFLRMHLPVSTTDGPIRD